MANGIRDQVGLRSIPSCIDSMTNLKNDLSFSRQSSCAERCPIFLMPLFTPCVVLRRLFTKSLCSLRPETRQDAKPVKDPDSAELGPLDFTSFFTSTLMRINIAMSSHELSILALRRIDDAVRNRNSSTQIVRYVRLPHHHQSAARALQSQ